MGLGTRPVARLKARPALSRPRAPRPAPVCSFSLGPPHWNDTRCGKVDIPNQAACGLTGNVPYSYWGTECPNKVRRGGSAWRTPLVRAAACQATLRAVPTDLRCLGSPPAAPRPAGLPRGQLQPGVPLHQEARPLVAPDRGHLSHVGGPEVSHPRSPSLGTPLPPRPCPACPRRLGLRGPSLTAGAPCLLSPPCSRPRSMASTKPGANHVFINAFYNRSEAFTYDPAVDLPRCVASSLCAALAAPSPGLRPPRPAAGGAREDCGQRPVTYRPKRSLSPRTAPAASSCARTRARCSATGTPASC